MREFGFKIIVDDSGTPKVKELGDETEKVKTKQEAADKSSSQLSHGLKRLGASAGMMSGMVANSNSELGRMSGQALTLAGSFVQGGILMAGLTAFVALVAKIASVMGDADKAMSDMQKATNRVLGEGATKIEEYRKKVEDLAKSLRTFGMTAQEASLSELQRSMDASENGAAKLSQTIQDVTAQNKELAASEREHLLIFRNKLEYNQEERNNAFAKVTQIREQIAANSQLLGNLRQVQSQAQERIGLQKQEEVITASLIGKDKEHTNVIRDKTEQIKKQDEAMVAAKARMAASFDAIMGQIDAEGAQDARVKQERIDNANRVTANVMDNLEHQKQLYSQFYGDLAAKQVAAAAAQEDQLKSFKESMKNTVAAAGVSTMIDLMIKLGSQSATTAKQVAASFLGTARSMLQTLAVMAALKALEANSNIPFGVPIALAAAAVVFGIAQGYIAKAKFAQGGVIRGGIPGHDSVPILAMPGERVLTVRQNQVFEQMIGAAPNGQLAPIGDSRRGDTSVVMNVAVAPFALPSHTEMKQWLVNSFKRPFEEAIRDGRIAVGG